MIGCQAVMTSWWWSFCFKSIVKWKGRGSHCLFTNVAAIDEAADDCSARCWEGQEWRCEGQLLLLTMLLLMLLPPPGAS
jgi:hypothetical protein